jgi:hypothetical protein
MSNDQLAIALELARGVGKGRMISVGDISCDIEVSIPEWLLYKYLIPAVPFRAVWNSSHAPRPFRSHSTPPAPRSFPRTSQVCR